MGHQNSGRDLCHMGREVETVFLVQRILKLFIKLVHALDTDANGLLGSVPAGETERKYRDVLYRLSHLKTYEQKIVLRTAEVLVDELCRNR